MDVLGSNWAKITLLVAVGLFASSVGAEDRRAEVLLQRWGNAIKAAGPIAGRFTTYEYDTASNQFAEGVGSFRRDELGRLSVTVRDTFHDTPPALQPLNQRRFPGSSGKPRSQTELLSYAFTEEEDGWYFTGARSDGRENRMKLMGLPSALDPNNTQDELRNLFQFWSPEIDATGVLHLPLLLPALKGIEYHRPRSRWVTSSEMVVRCAALIPTNPDVPTKSLFLSRIYMDVEMTFRAGSPYPHEISLNGFLSPTRTIHWVFHDVEDYTK
ncbi:MAG: hypothetical protein KF777_25225 [Planctomycetaceae bacterium]|nr:hypothetical protein [Planctomycetaceae bacterium]